VLELLPSNLEVLSSNRSYYCQKNPSVLITHLVRIVIYSNIANSTEEVDAHIHMYICTIFQLEIISFQLRDFHPSSREEIPLKLKYLNTHSLGCGTSQNYDCLTLSLP
jgi:hypothetical protein